MVTLWRHGEAGVRALRKQEGAIVIIVSHFWIRACGSLLVSVLSQLSFCYEAAPFRYEAKTQVTSDQGAE